MRWFTLAVAGVLLGTLLPAAAVHAAQWKRLYTAADRSVEMDLAGIRRRGDVVMAWVKFSYQKDQPDRVKDIAKGKQKVTDPTASTSAYGSATGIKPNAPAGASMTATARIEAIDPGANTVTFRGRDGQTHNVAVRSPDMQKFIRTLKPGDHVNVTYTSYRSMLQLWAYQCTLGRHALMQFTEYSGVGGDGAVIASDSHVGYDWSYPEPDTIGDAALKIACSHSPKPASPGAEATL